MLPREAFHSFCSSVDLLPHEAEVLRKSGRCRSRGPAFQILGAEQLHDLDNVSSRQQQRVQDREELLLGHQSFRLQLFLVKDRLQVLAEVFKQSQPEIQRAGAFGSRRPQASGRGALRLSGRRPSLLASGRIDDAAVRQGIVNQGIGGEWIQHLCHAVGDRHDCLLISRRERALHRLLQDEVGILRQGGDSPLCANIAQVCQAERSFHVGAEESFLQHDVSPDHLGALDEEGMLPQDHLHLDLVSRSFRVTQSVLAAKHARQDRVPSASGHVARVLIQHRRQGGSRLNAHVRSVHLCLRLRLALGGGVALQQLEERRHGLAHALGHVVVVQLGHQVRAGGCMRSEAAGGVDAAAERSQDRHHRSGMCRLRRLRGCLARHHRRHVDFHLALRNAKPLFFLCGGLAEEGREVAGQHVPTGLPQLRVLQQPQDLHALRHEALVSLAHSAAEALERSVAELLPAKAPHLLRDFSAAFAQLEEGVIGVS
eukprot:scaffold2538_cov235-Pinguiococcus_pyrenoidosus.AAC.6